MLGRLQAGGHVLNAYSYGYFLCYVNIYNILSVSKLLQTFQVGLVFFASLISYLL